MQMFIGIPSSENPGLTIQLQVASPSLGQKTTLGGFSPARDWRNRAKIHLPIEQMQLPIKFIAFLAAGLLWRSSVHSVAVKTRD